MTASRSTRRARGLTLALLAAFCLSLLITPAAQAQSTTGSTTVTSSPSGSGATATSAPTSGGAAGDEVHIVSTLKVAGAPVKGITMIVSQDGSEIGRATSGSDGSVAVVVPGAGQYTVKLDPSTFPKDVALAKDAPTQLTPMVLGNNDRPVIFRLVRGNQAAEKGPTTLERLASLLASGLRFGLVIALAAVGLSLIFGTTGLTNFAHGELLTFGAMATWYLNSNAGGLGLPLLVAAVGGVALSAVFGAGFDLVVYRPLRRRGMPIISQMVVSIGLAMATRYFFAVIFGSSAKQYSQYAAQAPSVHLGPVSLRPKDLVIAAVAFAALLAVGLFLQRSRLGTAVRAVSDNPSLAIASGINDNRVILLVWAFAGALGGLAGTMLGATEGVQWNMGQHVLLVMFAAVLLGGLGTTFGAMVGGIFVGVVSDLSTFWLDSDLKIVVALATLVAVLLIKPSGVFGVRVRKA